MDDCQDKDIIAHLKNEINMRDKDIHLAATYGNQLFEEKAALQLKLEELNCLKEALEQEKHSLQLELETCNKTVASLTHEVESQRDRLDNLSQRLKTADKENVSVLKKFQNLIKENQFYKKSHEELDIENKSLKDKISLQDKQIKNFQDQTEKSLCETEKDDHPDLLSQLNTYMLNNKELQDALSESQCQLETSKRNEKHLQQVIKDLEEAIIERDTEIRANCAEIKKIKEEKEELQAEIEILKFDKIDTKRRGNSMFAELDDRRTVVEKEYKKLQNKFEKIQKNYEANKEELDKARSQLAILQSVASRDYQQNYIDKLEASLAVAQNEICELQNKLTNLSNDLTKDSLPKGSGYEYLRAMLKKSQEKEKELLNENLKLRNRNVSSNNKIIDVQKLHYKTKEDLDSAQQEIIRLKLLISDLEQGLSSKLNTYDLEQKPNIDVFEGFQPKSKCEKLDKSIYLPDATIIPGELELDDDGFQPAKPPRKSNKFILQEFNRAEDVDNDGNSAKEKKVLNLDVPNENQSVRPQQRYTKSTSSKNKDNNCAQQ